jgi:regulation of enolase protein 1 (concanavalin A-like superfamily)
MSELRGFPRLLRAEWTKFRTIRGWVIGMLVMVLATVLFGLLGPAGSSFECAGPDGQACTAAQTPPTGPEGGAVNDHFYFVHQPLAANGEITARVTSFTGAYSLDGAVKHPGTQPWSKAGIIIKDNTSPGSAYAAMMVTGANSVRMQFNYVHDIAGPPGANWLRLTRSGDTITGYSSADGTRWTMVGRTDLPGLAPAARAGLFATSPEHSEVSRTFAGTDERSGPSQATGVFDHVSLPGPWTGDAVGGHTPGAGFEQHGDQFTVTGSGDIAPMVASGGRSKTVSDSLVGVFAGLIAVIVVAAMFITGEYRRGLIRTTLAASPRRGRVLAAKAIVIGAVTFVAGLVSSTLAVLVVGAIVHDGARGGRYRGPARRRRRPRVGGRDLVAPQCGRGHSRHRGDRPAVHPRHGVDPARRGLGLAAAAHAGRGLRDPAEHARVSTGQLQVHTGHGLLPLAPLGWVRGALRVRGSRPCPGRPDAAPEGRMRQALRAEWTKSRTMPGTFWLLFAVVALTVALSATAVAATCPACDQDPVQTSLTGVLFGQAVVVILAVLAVSGEYSSRMILTTFSAMPGRITVLAAKALIVSLLVLATGMIAVLASAVLGSLSLTDGPTLRATAGSVLYLVLIGLLSVGVAAAVRDSAAAIGIVLGVLYLFPIVITVVPDPDWHRHLQQIGPMTAGLAARATVHLDAQPLRPWEGISVVTAWATGGLLLGGLILRRRDA